MTSGKRLTLLTLCFAVLVAQVDMAVVNLATRPISAHFHAGVDALQWVLDAYNLVYAVLLLTGGLLADLYGRRRIFMIGLVGFSIGSETGGSIVAPSMRCGVNTPLAEINGFVVSRTPETAWATSPRSPKATSL